MARGYPEPKVREVEPPALLPQGACVICKHRVALDESTMCAVCARALGEPGTRDRTAGTNGRG